MGSCSGKNFHFALWSVTGRVFTWGFGLPGSWSREGPVPSGASRGEIPGAGGRPRPLPGEGRSSPVWGRRQSLVEAGGPAAGPAGRERPSEQGALRSSKGGRSPGVLLPCRNKRGAGPRRRRPPSSCGSPSAKSLTKESGCACCFQSLSAARCSSTAPEVRAAQHLVTGRDPCLFSLQRARIKKC